MNAVEIKNLTKNFGNIIAIDNISLNIKKGQITGLIGADASGKTTLMRLIIGLLLSDKGEISTLELNPRAQKEAVTACIGYMPQKFGMYEDLTVKENLDLYADLKGVSHDFEKVLTFTNLTKFQNRLAGKLSGGMKQKLGLACTLLGSPELLILDEPSVGVDPISRRELIKLVKDSITENTTVLWSTAYLDEAQNFDEAIILDKGKIIYQGPHQKLGDTNQKFEEKVIELMGGYKEKESEIAKDYNIKNTDVEFVVEADDLVKKYGEFYAVKNNTFKIRRGEIFGLLGPNGAGKSTSFKMMCGLSTPTNGTARIMGVDIKKNPTKARSNLGYMAQKFSLYGDLTVLENLRFFAGVYGIPILKRKKRLDEIIKIFNFEEYQDIMSKELPLGIKQRLSMACALIHEPAVLFLDEPTSGVDIIGRKEFWTHINALSKKGVTVLVTTHFMDEAEYCDRISLFYNGETVAIGTPDELKKSVNANSMEETFIKILEKNQGGEE
ncbi:MAG: ATP-binding cassette domain-containing protein [Clostridiaceae bacterium]|jgi:ABC-type multidrug transport system ATPase subunit|nr:ATP-binding cassette domain-containing protein [Clostridiaceae bacterium]